MSAVRPSPRSVRGQILTSTELPAICLQFDRAFRYIGSQEVILHGRARAEQYFFVDADEQGRIGRMYWVQFEGFLPGNTHTYRYQANRIISMAGLDFIADAKVRSVTKESVDPPDSDGEFARAFLESKGYHLPGEGFLWQRLVHLAGEARRDELMIVYIEDLDGADGTTGDDAAEGTAAACWAAVSTSLLQRALQGIEARIL